MKYLGNNPVGIALAGDTTGAVRDQLLQDLLEHGATVQRQMREASAPTVYQQRLSALHCTQTCAQVVKEFHASCVSAGREQAGLSSESVRTRAVLPS